MERFEGVLPLVIDIPNYYWQVFDPFDDEDADKVVGSMIFDDLNDIYRDLKEGLDEHEIGEVGDAVYDWKDGASGHWGDHAVSLIKALHWLRQAH